MCAISGFIDFTKISTLETLKNMISSITHRGPDDMGVELMQNETSAIGLAQARLSIIDLTQGGRQPMHYKHWYIVFNGEIYNYKEIKVELLQLGHLFKTESDTEVILHAYEEWGVDSVHRFIGMFVYLIYDEQKQSISITRDRAGVKPLYYYWQEDLFLFSSELKAFHKHPKFIKKIDQRSLGGYFNRGHIEAPNTIFENTKKLLPGHHLKLNLKKKNLKTDLYWKVENFYSKPKLQISYEDAKTELHSLLQSACNYRMVADVPVGVFLSGGYDSTAVTAIIQSNQKEKLKTFTLGFEDKNSEIPFAKKTATYLGTEHTEYVCTAKEAKEIISTLAFVYDEPFADISAIPTILVSQLARNQVKVALSADGGDEVFAGYTSYLILKNHLVTLNKIPYILKPSVKNIGGFFNHLIPSSAPVLKHKMNGFLRSIQKNNLQESAELFHYMNSFPEDFQQKLFSTKTNLYTSCYEINTTGFHHPIDVALAIDYKGYLQNEILTKVDRATMSVGLEGREPLLDHRLIEFAAQLPVEYKWDGKIQKRILKDIVHQYIPKEMMNRPKTGFDLPIYPWLRGDLAYLIDEYLSPEALNQSGLFNVTWVIEQVNLFKSNKLHYQPFIWKLLMFQMWYEKWMK